MRFAPTSFFRGFLSLTMLVGMASMAYGQAPTGKLPSAADAEAARTGLGQIVQMSPAALTKVALPPAARILEIEKFSAALKLEKDPVNKKAMSAAFSTSMQHKEMEERKKPNRNDVAPSPEVMFVMLSNPALNHVFFWNHAALDMTSLDYNNPTNAEPTPPDFGEQPGPPCTSRAMAMVHMAMFEALNAVEHLYISYTPPGGAATVQQNALQSLGVQPAQVTATAYDESSAIAEAAHVLLTALYAENKTFLDMVYYRPDIMAIETAPNHPTASAILNGKKLGNAIALEIMAERVNDGALDVSDGPQRPFNRCVAGTTYVNKPNRDPNTPDQWSWKQDPLRPESKAKEAATGSYWGQIKPWVITNVTTYRPLPLKFDGPEFLNSVEYSRVLGGDQSDPPSTPQSLNPVKTLTVRSLEQTEIGTFWAYDGTAGLCAPPRLYNMITTSIATKEHVVKTAEEMARLLALANVALADAAIAAWDAKYFYQVGRPVTGIRSLTVPAEVGGHAVAMTPYATWTPLGAPTSNGLSRNVSPPFPGYPSGHATFGGALFKVLGAFWNIDLASKDSSFQFVSDEYNNQNLDPQTGIVRPLKPRWFNNFGQAESENAMSRVYLGIHWSVDAEAGVAQGHLVGEAVLKGLYAKLP